MNNVELLSEQLASMFRDRSGVAPDFENEARRILRMFGVPTGETGTYNNMNAAELSQAERRL